MRILYDHQIFDFQQFGGVSRIFYELIVHFENDPSIEWTQPILYSDNEYLRQMPCFKSVLIPRSRADHYKNFLWGAEFKNKRILYRLKAKVWPEPVLDKETEINKARSIEKIKEGNFDVFHPTYYDDYFLQYLNGKPFVITVYDLIHQIFPEFGMFEKIDKNRNLLDKASKIIAISESTKLDLVNLFNVDERKIAVTHLANSLGKDYENISDEFKKKLPRKFLLYVGGRGAYKNFLFFIHVVATIIEEDKDLYVVCTGAPFDSNERYLFNKTGVTNHIYHTYVNDNELIYLYKNAISLIFPSMYEGFGLPILEAFNCGCPVLVSNSSSLAEIGEDAVVKFEPKNPASMKHAIKSIVHDTTLREDKIRKGYQQVKKFSWQKTADETKQIYQEILSQKPEW